MSNCKTIAICNQKGGVGKTTTTVNLGVGLAMQGKKVLLMQREIKKQMSNTGIGTKSQQALKLQHEQYKTERKKKNREQKQAEEQRLFELRQQKKKEKHRGR